MKIHTSHNKYYTRSFFYFLLFTFYFFFSCKKNSDNNTAPVFHTLDLHPAAGNDVSVFYFNDSSGIDSLNASTTNFYGDSILYVNAFTSPFSKTGANIFVKFDSAALLPSTAKILIAKLYLYGTDSSNIPAYFFGNTVAGGGNSFFSGLNDSLPYYDSIAHLIYNTSADTAYDNTLLVQQVSANWDAHSITYNSQPAVTSLGANYVAASSSRWNNDISIDVTSLVQQWFQSASSNFGISLSILNTDYGVPGIYINHQMVFYSSSAPFPSKRPELIIVYQ